MAIVIRARIVRAGNGRAAIDVHDAMPILAERDALRRAHPLVMLDQHIRPGQLHLAGIRVHLRGKQSTRGDQKREEGEAKMVLHKTIPNSPAQPSNALPTRTVNPFGEPPAPHPAVSAARSPMIPSPDFSR
jgi:hypothetical protein